jgi:3-dehydro-L-gulonate 2-dehydrogenase
MRVPFDELQETLRRVLVRLGFRDDRAALCARLFAETTRDGVYSHGLNRFPRFLEMIRRGVLDVQAEPIRTGGAGAVERWDGRLGPGNLNAWSAMQRAIDLAALHGIGCVALGNTNHWMRGGTYGWQAADAGRVAMCWTNTMPNLPPWGARDPRLGNNPFIIAVPRADGHVVLDMAMSQFSYGALASYREQRRLLPVAGGYDQDGRLTSDAGAIEATGRPLPVGYWKGSGLAFALDLVAAMLAAGRATYAIPADPLAESGVSQLFVAFDPKAFGDDDHLATLADECVRFLHASTPVDDVPVRYPGERVLADRRENLALGVPVDAGVWDEVRALAAVD